MGATNKSPKTTETKSEVTTGTVEMSEADLVKGFAQAVKGAVKRAHASGHWTSHVRDGQVIRVYPDGREEQVGTISQR